MKPEERKKLLHKLSILEHEQWMIWAKNILQNENIKEETKARWQKYFVSYDNLDTDVKELDINFAQKSLEVFEDFLNKKS